VNLTALLPMFELLALFAPLAAHRLLDCRRVGSHVEGIAQAYTCSAFPIQALLIRGGQVDEMKSERIVKVLRVLPREDESEPNVVANRFK